MKVRQRNVCHTCRARKLGCDGKQPACSQCILTGRKCGGYQHDLIFVPYSSAPTDAARQAQPTGSRATETENSTCIARGPSDGMYSFNEIMEVGCRIPKSSSLNRLSLYELMVCVVWHYTPESQLPWLVHDLRASGSRICGSWVEVLPSITSVGGRDHVLASAIKALATSILNKSLAQETSNVESVHHYGSALINVNRGLRAAGYTYSDELAAAIMCLTLTELMIPTAKSAWMSHVKGVGELIRISGPEMYKFGISHKLFTGFRPLLIFEAILSRRSTFLALEDWKNIPFHLNPPSPMQSLLSDAAILPSALQNLDAIRGLPLGSANAVSQQALLLFVEVLGRLGRWSESYTSEHPGPLYWPRATQSRDFPHLMSSSQVPLWFPSIEVVNVLTHLWAFQIICLVQIERLGLSYPLICHKELLLEMKLPLRTLQENIVELATMICQSMEYSMQNQMRLYGKASTMFPLSTAYDTFKMYAKQTQEKLAWCEGIMDQLVLNGLNLTPMFSKIS